MHWISASCTLICVAIIGSACDQANKANPEPIPKLVGAWKANVQFHDGAFASLKDLEFYYTFNVGGTMTESSNYDGVPPVPPAYGIWKQSGDRQFEARYEFFTTKPPTKFEEISQGSGWLPSGYGILKERFALSADGASFNSEMTLDLFDAKGNPIEGGGKATGSGRKLGFD